MYPIRLITAATATVMLAACQSDKTSAVDAVPEELPKVEIDVVDLQDVSYINDYTANVEADNINNIAPASPNRIRSIAVEVGDHVAKGQTLVTLDNSAAQQLKINLDQAERDYLRAVQLLEIGAGTQQSVDQLKAQYDALKSQYGNMLENTVLTSPVTGVVINRNYDPGDMTSTSPVLTVGQLTPFVKVMIDVTENDLSKIKTNMPVTVAFDAFEGETFTGKVSRIHPSVDASTRTFRTEILVSNPDGRILPGMFARVSVNLGTHSNVVVPDRAIVKQTGSGNRYVYVYHDGKVNFNKVETGRRFGDAYELLSGVNPGDTVIIAGQTRLADGVAVEITNN